MYSWQNDDLIIHGLSRHEKIIMTKFKKLLVLLSTLPLQLRRIHQHHPKRGADAPFSILCMHEEMSRFSLSIDREPTLGYPMDVETPVTGENNGQGSSSLHSARLSCLRCDRWCPPCRGKKVENG
jgi:hypothetical protein